MWYEKKKARELATRPKRDALNEQTRLAIRARLAIMQFRRHRMNNAMVSAEEEGRRKDLGIWSFGGGKKQGPLKPRFKVTNEIEKEENKDGTDESGENNEQMAKKKEVRMNKNGILNTEKNSSIPKDAKDKKNTNEYKNNNIINNVRKSKKVLEKADHKVSKTSDSPPSKAQVPPIPLNDGTPELDDGIYSKSNTDRSEKSPDFMSRDLSESPNAATGGESSGSKRPGSSRKLFTVVTPAFHQSEARGSPSFKRKSMPSDSTSVKSMQNNRANSTNPDPPPRPDLPPRPTTSFREKRQQPEQQSPKKLVGAALHSSPARSTKDTSGKLAAGSPVKVKPKTIDLGDTKGDSGRVASVAKAGAKSSNQ